MRYVIPVALTLLALAGCTAPPPAPEVRPAPIVAPPSRPVLAPPPPASDWNDWPFTPGDWRYEQRPEYTAASFEGGSQDIKIYCDRRSRRVGMSVPIGTPVTIRTTTITRTIAPSVLTTSDQPVASLLFAPNDPLLDAIAFSRGRFVVDQQGVSALVLPPHAEIGRVIEDCRG